MAVQAGKRVKGSSLAEISRATGMGIATVSEILRNKPGYREETRRRVLTAAEEMNYRPNLLARGLRAGTTKTIGLIAGDLYTSITMRRIAAIEREINQNGYHAYVMHEHSVAGDVRDQVEVLLTRQVDGIIFCRPVVDGDEALLRVLQGRGPSIFIGAIPGGASWGVAFDQRPAMREVARHLADFGHRRAVFMRTHSDWVMPALKVDGWRQALDEAGMALDLRDDYRLPPVWDVERETYLLMRQRLSEGPPPTALLMNNDSCAIAAMAALKDAGFRVPEDVSVVGYDGLPEAEYVRPGLTTLYLPGDTFVSTVVSMLFTALRHPEKHDRGKLAYQTNIRQSTGPARPGG